jgi:hypothetical protein
LNILENRKKALLIVEKRDETASFKEKLYRQRQGQLEYNQLQYRERNNLQGSPTKFS